MLSDSLAGLAQSSIVLVATGSSLPEPLYVAWGDEYHKRHPSLQLRYLPEGTASSGRKIISGIGDMGGGDAPIPDKQLKSATVQIVQLPSVLIGIAIVFDLPNVTGELHLSGPVLADVFLGKIKVWNDPAIAKLNPEMQLPALPINVVHR